MIAWMQNWDTCNLRTSEHPLWYGQMSLPRELHIKNGRLYRKFSGSRRAIIHQRRSLVNHTNGCLKLRLVLDRYSVEVFYFYFYF